MNSGESSSATLFLSHSSQDGRLAFELANQLEATARYRVWMGETAIGVGRNYADEIVRSIRECDGFVLLVSRASLASANVQREVGIAVSSGKVLLPVMLESGLLDDPALKDHWRYWLQTAQTTDWTNAAAVASQIRRCIDDVTGGPAAHQPNDLVPTEHPPKSPRAKHTVSLIIGGSAFLVVTGLVATAAVVSFNGVRPTANPAASTAPRATGPSPATATGPSPMSTQTYGSVILKATQRDTYHPASVGQCVDNVSSFTVVDCNETHQLEIYAIARIINQTLPQEAALRSAADEFCASAYPTYLGDPSAEVGPQLFPMEPIKDSWKDGDRSIWCTFNTLPPVRGSVRNR